MKIFVSLALIMMSPVAFAGPLEDAIQKVEADLGATCTKVRTSTSICTGEVNYNAATCFYNVKFKCENADGNFDVKIRMMSQYSVPDNGRIEKVLKVIISR